VKELLPYVGLLAFVLSVVNAIYQRSKDSHAELKDLANKIDEVTRRLTVLETKAEIYFKGMSVSAAGALHSPHTKELDVLLEKFQRDEIQSEKDLSKLKGMLQDVADGDDDPQRRKYALDILTLIHVRFEIGGDLVESFRQT
jgi:hypothetical protein